MASGTQDHKEFAEDALGRLMTAGADEAQVLVQQTSLFEVEFDNHGVQLVRDNSDERTTLTVFSAQRKGQAALNGRQQDDLKLAAEIAMSGAGSGEPDAANALPTDGDSSTARFGTARADRDAMARAVEGFLACLGDEWPRIQLAPSHYSFHKTDRFFANSMGACHREQRGLYSFAAMFSGRDGDNTTSFNYTDAATFEPLENLLDGGGLRRLLESTDQSFGPRPVPAKFVGDLVLTPPAAGELFGSLYQSLRGLTLLGGLSPYADKLGEKIASDALTVRNMPADATMPLGTSFDEYGIRSGNLAFIDKGVLADFLVDHYASRKLETPYTASDLCPVVAPGDKSIEEIIAGTERGILLGRFSGGRPNVQLDISGVAKNSFYIEDGKIRYPLIETMISCNLQDLVRDIVAVSKESVDYGGSRYPYISASGVTISTA